LKRNEELLQPLKGKITTEDKKQALKAASGISNEQILDSLLTANFGPDSIIAVGIVPLLAVAWADGSLDENEKRAVLEAAEAEGLSRGTEAYNLFESWLLEPPSQELLTAWRDFISAAKFKFSTEALTALREDVLDRAQKIARASGGALGISSVSAAEEKMVCELEEAFDRF
jgi:hypothetical protein